MLSFLVCSIAGQSPPWVGDEADGTEIKSGQSQVGGGGADLQVCRFRPPKAEYEKFKACLEYEPTSKKKKKVKGWLGMEVSGRVLA